MSDISLNAEVITMLDGTYYVHVQVVTFDRCITKFSTYERYSKTFICERVAQAYCRELLNYFNNSRV